MICNFLEYVSQESYSRGQSHPPYQVPYHPPPSNSRQTSIGNRQTNRQGRGDLRGAGSIMGQNNDDDWDDNGWAEGGNDANKTSPLRHQNQENRDLRNKISGNLGDRDLRNKLSGNSRERDVKNRIGANRTGGSNRENTPRYRNDGTQKWGGLSEDRQQKDEWDDDSWDNGAGNNQNTNEGKYGVKVCLKFI